MTAPKIGNKWRRMQEVYRHFSRGWTGLDYSDNAALEMYVLETYGPSEFRRMFGKYAPGENNGYAVGKKWMDVTVAMWNEDIEKGLLFPFELYEDKDFAGWHWWLDKIGMARSKA